MVVKMLKFRDEEGKLIAYESEVRVNIPTQIDEETAELYETVAGAIGASSGAALSSKLVLNILIAGSTQQLIGSIKNLQVIVFIGLTNAIVPTSSQLIFA